MLKRACPIFGVLWLAPLLAASAVTAQTPRPAAANDPVSLARPALPVTPPPVTAPPVTPAPGREPDVTGGAAERATAAEPAPPGPDAVPAGPVSPSGPAAAADAQRSGGLESRALGRPNGPLGSRPVADASSGRRGGPLAALDPRRNDITRVVSALGVVLGLLALGRLVLRRFAGGLPGGGRPGGVVEILARYPIARGQSLVLLKLARRILLLHQAGTSMATLSEVADPDEVADLLARLEAGARAGEAVRFRRTLRTFQQEHERLEPGPSPVGGAGDEIEIVDLTRGPGRGLAARREARRLLP